MRKLVSTKDMPREQWLEYRRKSIGGSEAATIAGLNRYSSLYALWADKMGLLPEKEDNEQMRQGRDFENYVAQRLSVRMPVWNARPPRCLIKVTLKTAKYRCITMYSAFTI